MIIIRPIQQKDHEVFSEFSFESILGMTNLPRNRDKLFEKIARSALSFSTEVEKPGEEEYYFVLEDLTTGRVGGTCGIIAQSMLSYAHHYLIESIPMHAKDALVPKECKVLRIIPNQPNSSEICALYLQPTFRHSGQGRLLSLSRFLFIAAFQKRFKTKIVAEMRGYIDQRQISPFWEGIGRHFCNLSFVELMARLEIDHSFIPDILPSFPIYISLLPKETQEAIGKMHDSTKPAYHMLIQENFTYNHEVDIFEGGPILSAPTTNIRTIKESALIQIEITSEGIADEKEYILGNERLDFRACFGRIQMISDKKGLLNEEVALALQVKNGDWIRYAAVH